MKKILFVLLMVLSLVISLPAQAAVETLANFTFDSEADYTDGGNAKAVVYSGSPVWKAEHEGREGVMYFDGSSGLSITKSDGSSLLTNVTDLTVSFDACYTSSSGDNHWVFLAIPSDHSQNPWWSKHVGISETNSAIRLERPLDAGSDSNALTAQGITTGAWHHVEAHFTSSGMSLYVDGDLKGTNSNANDLTSLLGSSSQILLGVGNWGNNINWYDPDFTGYIDNFKITGEKSIRAALNPFNNLGNDRPNLYGNENKTLTLKVQGSDSSLERIVFPVAEGAKITLPSEDSLRSGFTIGDTTYILEGELENPRKLIGWYNIADGKYYSVLKGDAKNVTLTGKNDVFYGDWIASSYDFLGGNTDGLITTADTSDFIDVNVFDYSELVNVNSMTVQPNGVGSESWKINDAVVKDWLSFSDWGTYQTEGSLGFPFNRPANSANGLMDVDKGPYEDLLTKSIIEHLFNQNSVPGKGTYVPGINYLGKGNYLFSYDPATGMYSYDCATNAAVYKQDTDPAGDDEGRFYVYDGPITYHSDGEQADFFPLNKKTDSLYKENGVPNYWFGMDFTMDFWLPDNGGSGGNQITNADGTNSDMIFEFEGDDDMWVLIDGKLVLDIGGIHDPVEGTINFSTGDVTVKNENGATTETIDFTAGDHKMEIYYLERGGDKSNCTIKFNLLPEYKVEEPGIDTVKIVKEWVGNPPTMPAEITVELYDENNPADVIKTATLAKDEDGNWSHSFSNLPHTNSKGSVIKYSVREKNSNPNFQVNVDGEVHVFSNAWVFTDQAGLKNEKYVVIGNGKGQVLGVDLDTHDVAKIDKDNNIIIKLTEGDAKPLLWEIEPAASYPGGKHFYLKNVNGKYLCISSETDSLHLHDTAAQASVFYLNASGDLQDATTGHRLVSANGGFGVNTNVGGNVTVESANKASLYVLRESETTAYSFTITNTYVDPTVPMGTLQISKTISGNAADKNDEFTFLVTLKDANGSLVAGTFDTHTFVDGKYSFTLKSGESENFADLPIGVTYTVTETPALGYVQTAPTEPATGVISTEPSVVSFTNMRDVVRLVKVTDPTGLTVAPKVTVSGSDGSVVTAEALTANNAAKYLEIPVKPGVTYTVAESGQEVAGYTFVGSELTAKDAEVAVSGMTFTVSKSGLTTIPVLTLTNSYTLDSVTVTIRKVSTGLTEGIAYPAPKVSIYAANSIAPVWTGTLTPNGSALPVKLLPGTYTVKEAIDEVEGYGFTSVLYVNDAASADKTFTLAANALNTELRLDNFYAAEFSTLTLTKTVKGESGSKTSFSFRITLTDDKGQPITERLPYTGTMDGAAPLNGVITSGSTVALRNGGSITVQLPLGVHYEVEEQEQEGYVLVSSEGEKGVIEKGGAKAAFVNKPQYTATVTKVWEGDTADVRPASVQVQLMLNGKPVGDPVSLNAANGWKHTYTGLDAKGPYTVDELTVAEGYVSAVEEGEGNTFVITNSYIVIPPTGDAAHPALYLLALAGSAALLMLLRKRKAA